MFDSAAVVHGPADRRAHVCGVGRAEEPATLDTAVDGVEPDRAAGVVVAERGVGGRAAAGAGATGSTRHVSNVLSTQVKYADGR